MLASMQTFMNGLTSWLPGKLQHPAEILLYFVILGTMSVTPLILWLGWAVRSTDREAKG
jgi:hypothetical protein